MLLYSLYRIVIFVVVLMALYLAGLRSWPLLMLAAVLSAVISLVAMNRRREDFARKLEDKVEQRRAKSSKLHRSAEEDEDDELDD